MKRYLKKHGIQTEEVQRFKIKEMRFTDFVKSKSSSAGILLVKNKGTRAGHFIVFDGKYIYDPMEGICTAEEYDSYEFVCAWVGVLGS